MMSLGKTFTHAVKYVWSYVRRFYYTGSCRKVRCMIPAARLSMSVVQRMRHSVRRRTQRMQRRAAAFRRRGAGRGPEEPETEETETEEFVPYEVDDTFNLPPIVALMIAFVYMLIGSAIYTCWETTWSFMDAFYFVFISLSTIGLGDLVPEHPKYFMATSLYLFVGLALVAMVINVVMEMMHVSLSKAADKMLTTAADRLGNRRVVMDEDSIKKLIARLQPTSFQQPRGAEEGEIREEIVRPTSAAFQSSAAPPTTTVSTRRGSI